MGQLSQGAIRASLVDVPNISEDQVYEKALDMINESDRNHEARLALAWIYYACRPLHVWELSHALAMNLPGAQDIQFVADHAANGTTIQSWCSGLIHILPSSQTFAFKHQGIREYLERRIESTFGDLDVRLSIPRTCLRFLSLAATGSDEYTVNEGLYPYAGRCWFYHIEEEDQAKELLNDLIPVVHVPKMTKGQKQWLAFNPVICSPETAMDIACDLELEWLFDFLLSHHAGELFVGLDGQWVSLARRWPSKFITMYDDHFASNKLPSENAVLGLIISKSFEIKRLKAVFTKHANFQLTIQMFVAAAESKKPDIMLALLWDHYEGYLSRSRQYPVSFPASFIM
jgi:hypothetical protein